MNKFKKVILGLFIVFSLFIVLNTKAYAESNPSVNLDDTPEVVEIGYSELIESDELLPSQGDIFVGPIDSSATVEYNRVSPTQLIVTPIGKANEITDEKLNNNMTILKEAYDRINSASSLSDLVKKETLEERLYSFSNTEKLELSDLVLYSLFDIYIENETSSTSNINLYSNEETDSSTENNAKIQLKFDFSFLSTDILFVMKYENRNFRLLESNEAVLLADKSCVVTLDEPVPLAVFSVPAATLTESFDRLDVNYKGEYLFPLLITTTTIVCLEAISLFVLSIILKKKRNNKLYASHGLLLFGTYINIGTVIIVGAEVIIGIVLGIMIFNQIKQIKKGNKVKDEK